MNPAEKPDLSVLFRKSLSEGSGVLSGATIKNLTEYAEVHSAVLVIVETYRLKEGLEIPCPEYGISYPDYEAMCRNVGPRDCRRTMREAFDQLLMSMQAETDTFGFEVWFETLAKISAH